MEFLKIDRIGDALWLTFDRPERLNALSYAMTEDLLRFLQDVARDDSVAALVLTGAGRGFCAGGDLHSRQHRIDERLAAGLQPETSEELERDLLRRMDSAALLADMPKVTIAMVNGPCVGAGLALATACDFRIAGASASFKCGFRSAGLPGDFGITHSLIRLLGAARAQDMLLLDRSIDAAEAERSGLVQWTVPDAELRDRTQALVDELLAKPRWAVGPIKRNVATGVAEGREASFAAEAATTIQCGATARANGRPPASALKR